MTTSAHVLILRGVQGLFELRSPLLLGGQTKALWLDLEGENICQEEIESRVIESFGDFSVATLTSTGLYHQDSRWRGERSPRSKGC